MKLIFQLLLILFISSILISCRQNKNEHIDIKAIGLESTDAINPYFTKDNKGNIVLCWTSKALSDSVYKLHYAVYDSINHIFAAPIIVSTSTNLSTSPESMGKVAFKGDGTVIAMFGRAHESPENPFAGGVYYSVSTDNGQNWSTEQFVHSDTSKNVGHSFFDIATLKDGEIAAIWLDGRFGKSEKGSALFFSKTQGGNEFLKDTLLGKNTCECCRTEILADDMGNIHIAYRNIAYPAGIFGRQVRDMAYISSKDNGMTFSKPFPISNDNWEVEGCPHTGPSLAISNQQVHAVWFTAGGETGLFYTSSMNLDSKFNQRTLLSSSGRHPQMAALANDKIAIVYEDNLTQKTPMKENHSHSADTTMKMDHSKMKMNHHKEESGETSIVLQLFKNGIKDASIEVTNGKQADHHAVITSYNDQLLIAWVHEKNGKSQINYSNLSGI